MSTSNVIIGAKYEHGDTGAIMRLEAASVPELDNEIFLVDEEYFTKDGFIAGWRGSWNEFLSQWTEYKQPELDFNPLPAYQQDLPDDIENSR